MPRRDSREGPCGDAGVGLALAGAAVSGHTRGSRFLRPTTATQLSLGTCPFPGPEQVVILKGGHKNS